MTVHQPRRPASEREIQESNELFGDLLSQLDGKATASFARVAKTTEVAEDVSSPASQKKGFFGWLRGPKGLA